MNTISTKSAPDIFSLAHCKDTFSSQIADLPSSKRERKSRREVMQLKQMSWYTLCTCMTTDKNKGATRLRH